MSPRVALIHARVGFNAVPPLGLLSMATVLRDAGFEARVWDPLPGAPRLLDEVAGFAPDLLGLSFLSAGFQRARGLAEALRARLPGRPLLIGGPHASALPQESLEALGADLCVVGEGEDALLAIAQACAAREPLAGLPGTLAPGGIAGPPRAPIEDLDRLPIPDRGLLAGHPGWYLAPPGVLRGLWRAGTTTLIAGRGCPHRCAFCASHVVGGRRPRQRSPALVAEELRWLIARWGLRGAWFLDDDLAVRPDWLAGLCAAIGPLGIEWSCQARLDRLEEPLARELAGAGCVQVEIGLESGSERVLTALRKDLSVAQVEARVAGLQRAGLRVMLNFMVGCPGEGPEDLAATFALARRLRPDFVEFNLCMPYPGSELYRRARAQGGLARGALDFDEGWSEHFASAPLLEGALPGPALMRRRAAMQNAFLLRNYGRIARGLLGSPRSQLRLLRCAGSLLRAEPAALLAALRRRELDPLLWRLYGAWSASFSGEDSA